MVNLAGETVRRQPFGHRVGVQECPIDLFGSRAQHTVETNGVCGHEVSPFEGRCLISGLEANAALMRRLRRVDVERLIGSIVCDQRLQCWKNLDSCYPLGYNLSVIASFAHKGLERFYRTGNVSGIQAIHSAKLRLILSLLDASQTVEGMRLPALKLH